jgi:hypothetical protein
MSTSATRISDVIASEAILLLVGIALPPVNLSAVTTTIALSVASTAARTRCRIDLAHACSSSGEPIAEKRQRRPAVS